MRAVFASTLAELAQKDSRVLLATADLGYMALEPFSDVAPAQFFNFGVAEQNMIGVCTGLAEAGFIPFAYSIATFASMRAYEFVRNGPIRHQLPVRIIGVGAGFEYGSAGPTHHGLEDAALFRIQPGLTVIAPADVPQARNALLATWDLAGPIYYRLSKDDKVVVPGLEGRFGLGCLEIVRQGSDVLILTMGTVTLNALQAAADLADEGIESTVAVVSNFNPSPITEIVRQARDHRFVVTVEAHYVNGGLGSLVAEALAEHGVGTRLVRCGVRLPARGKSGGDRYYHDVHGITREGIRATVKGAVSKAEPV